MTQVTWKCPSNIALIKYWGKKGNQLPANASLSFTLNECFSKTSVKLLPKINSDDFEFSFFFEGKPNPSFEQKLNNFFKNVLHLFPFLKEYRLEIHSENSFPHSSGIASSASAFGALALCLCSTENTLENKFDETDFYQKASIAARLGSGSACRSVYAPLALWGKNKVLEQGDDEFAVSYNFAHKIFDNFCDTILIADSGAKEVSSSLGHSLLNSNPFAENRFIEAQKNLGLLDIALRSGDLDLFNSVTESEALMLHALMMTSKPYFILMKPNTLNIIDSVWKFRKSTNLNMTITLDAGANVHLLYPDGQKEMVRDFIENELAKYCVNSRFINDCAGNGPEKI